MCYLLVDEISIIGDSTHHLKFLPADRQLHHVAKKSTKQNVKSHIFLRLTDNSSNPSNSIKVRSVNSHENNHVICLFNCQVHKKNIVTVVFVNKNGHLFDLSRYG
jgi:hypothetical protein